MKRNQLLKLFLSIAVFSLTATKVFSQTGSVTVLITDQNGIYVPGASVSLLETKKGDVTDFDGKFSIVSVQLEPTL